MTDKQYRAFLDLLMCADPWPVNDDWTQAELLTLADSEARQRGHPEWVTAYHHFQPLSLREGVTKQEGEA